MSDLLRALRSLLRSPGFLATSVLTLAIGIAATTTMVTIVSGLLFRPIPAADPERLVRIYPLAQDGRRENLLPYTDYEELRSDASEFAELTAYIPEPATARVARTGSAPREVLVYLVSGNYFEMLGTQAALGRTIARSDDTAAAPPVAVISHRLWQHLGGSANALGSVVMLNGAPFTISGVLPASFVGTEPLVPDLWVPLAVASAIGPNDRDTTSGRGVLLMGRLQPDTSKAAAEAQLSPKVRGLTRDRSHGDRRAGVTLRRPTFFPVDRDPLSVAMLMVLGTGLLLAATWANVSNLFLARVLARRRETAVRLAIGAGRFRVARQYVMESVCIAVAAAGLALLMSSWALSLLFDRAVAWLPFAWGTVLFDLRPDGYVFLWTVATGLATTVAIALTPAMQADRVSLTSALHGGPATIGRTRTGLRVRTVMTAAQIAISLALAIVAGLLARAAVRAEALELGFDPRGVLTTEYDLNRHRYTAARAAAFSEGLRERAARLPGVASATLASHVPLTGGLRTTQAWSPEAPRGGPAAQTRYVYVTSGYFRALRIPLMRGRDVGETSAPEVVVSDIVAQRLWPGGDGLGARLRTALNEQEYLVVGIARDTRARSLWRDKEAALYLVARTPEEKASTRLVVAGSGSLEEVADGLRLAARAEEPELAFAVTPLTAAVALWQLPSRAAAAASSALATIALAIASIGLFGVLSQLLAQQTRELGIRRALGADGRALLVFSLRQALGLVLPGLAGGVLLGHAIARATAAFLFDLSPADLPTYLAATAVAACAAIAACLLPARRAARVDPMTVLRME